MLWVRFELTIPALEWTKTVHALDYATTMIGKCTYSAKFSVPLFIFHYHVKHNSYWRNVLVVGYGIKKACHVIALHCWVTSPCITENMSRDRHPASPLARWLPSKDHIENTSRDRYPLLWGDLTAHVPATRAQRKHCCSIVHCVCVADVL
jgi:hypothetical protein